MAGNITFSNRLKELKGETSGRKFAEKCGISHAVMGKYLNGTSSPTLDSLIKISQATNVNIDWLSGAGNVSFENAHFLGASDFETIPLYSAEASAGCGSFQHDDSIIGEHLILVEDLKRLGIKKEDACAIKARGDSMSPTLMDGDLLVVDTQEHVGVYDGVYAISIDNQLLVKRLRYDIASQGYHIISDNPEHSNFLLTKDELSRLRVNGRIRQVVKNL
ncbi:prophage transcriptional regulator [Vibrio harveyi]|uniref:XRE family transcriptional regulator n=1 Tax=Vibrio harveyi TaxID=669 RepID=UPI000426DBB2|nr:S24 family peptidase [Vibrio harveyi]ELY1988958.1 helix-turn-helix domain-containing protein [Vibrio harveyi]GBL02653.1 prophage transcriptional regulator [Vibrio harveyi]